MPLWNTEQRSATIMVVDDVAGNRAILCRRLSRLGYDCVEADSGDAALERLSTLSPDIILLDYMMPQMSGIDLLRAIKSDGRTETIPVIMVTARTQGEATAAALGAGADDYVTKPIDFTNLEARIKNVLLRSKRDDQNRKINQVLDDRIAMRALEIADVREELESEKDRYSRLRSELSARYDAAPAREADCREENLRLLNAIDELMRKTRYPGIEISDYPTLLAEVKLKVDAIRKNLMVNRID